MSNFSNVNMTERGIKESKGLFTKCISEMNSEKKKNSVLSRQQSGMVNVTPDTSFKSQINMVPMIESVLP